MLHSGEFYIKSNLPGTEYGIATATSFPSFPQHPKTVILIVKPHFDLSRLVAFPIAAALVTLLVGCGQRGPLYLPTKPDAVKASPQPASTGTKAPTDSQIPASN